MMRIKVIHLVNPVSIPSVGTFSQFYWNSDSQNNCDKIIYYAPTGLVEVILKETSIMIPLFNVRYFSLMEESAPSVLRTTGAIFVGDGSSSIQVKTATIFSDDVQSEVKIKKP